MKCKIPTTISLLFSNINFGFYMNLLSTYLYVYKLYYILQNLCNICMYYIYLSAIHNISLFVQFLSYSFFICISSVLLYYVLFHAVMFRYVCRTVSDGTWSQSIFNLTRNFSEKRKFIQICIFLNPPELISVLCAFGSHTQMFHTKRRHFCSGGV